MNPELKTAIENVIRCSDGREEAMRRFNETSDRKETELACIECERWEYALFPACRDLKRAYEGPQEVRR